MYLIRDKLRLWTSWHDAARLVINPNTVGLSRCVMRFKVSCALDLYLPELLTCHFAEADPLQGNPVEHRFCRMNITTGMNTYCAQIIFVIPR